MREGRPVNLEQRINPAAPTDRRRRRCAYESRDLLALTAYVARQSRGMPIAIDRATRTAPFLEAGRAAFNRAAGPAQSLLHPVP